MAKGGSARPKVSTRRQRFLKELDFLIRVGAALLRLSAMGVFYYVHEHYVDPLLLEKFPLGTLTGDVAHGATQFAFLGIYVGLVIDMVRCFFEE
jgi:hypothetical protein